MNKLLYHWFDFLEKVAYFFGYDDSHKKIHWHCHLRLQKLHNYAHREKGDIILKLYPHCGEAWEI
ncbi:MAG: hypothetical protein Athens071426_407 [Parcubacteria group bacterium Athens0714_26]|nr:MAG: hypothetical protein Athens071426_407 [Parcubacteria group bacterium Athens0714_26]